MHQYHVSRDGRYFSLIPYHRCAIYRDSLLKNYIHNFYHSLILEFDEIHRNEIIKDSAIIVPIKPLLADVVVAPVFNHSFVFDTLDIYYNKLASFEERFHYAFKNNVPCKDKIRQTLFTYTVSYERSEENAITLFNHYVQNNISLSDIYSSITSIVLARYYRLAKLILDSCSMIIPSEKSAQYNLFNDNVPDEILHTLIIKGFFNHCHVINSKNGDAYDNGNNVFMHLAIRKKQAMIIDLIDYQNSDFNRNNGCMNIDLNYKNMYNHSLLFIAIQNGCVDLIRKLMTQLPITSFTESAIGYDSIHYAALINQEAVLCLLLEYYYNNNLKINSFRNGYSTHGLNIKRHASKRTPLMYAIENKMVNAIHKIGELFPASMNTAVEYGNNHFVSPIMIAFARKDTTIFNLLIHYGANADGFDAKCIQNLDITEWIYSNAYEVILKGIDTKGIEFKDGKAVIVDNKSVAAKGSPEYAQYQAKINDSFNKIACEYNWYRRKHFLTMLSEGYLLESVQSMNSTGQPSSNSAMEKVLSIKGIQECITKFI